MGLFTSKCPSCDADIDWFLKAPEDYVCSCGRPVSSEEIESSWTREYAKWRVENTKHWMRQTGLSEDEHIRCSAVLDAYVKQAESGRRSWESVNKFLSIIHQSVTYHTKTYVEAIAQHTSDD